MKKRPILSVLALALLFALAGGSLGLTATEPASDAQLQEPVPYCDQTQCVPCPSPCPEGRSAGCSDISTITSDCNISDCNVEECCPTGNLCKSVPVCCPQSWCLDRSI